MKSDRAFVADFEASHRWVRLVAEWLRQFGYTVEVPEPVLRPTAAERAAYADGGDLLVSMPYESVGRPSGIVEVKHRNVDFTGPDDYPYPTVFVNEAYKLTPERIRGVLSYVVINRRGTHVAVIPRDTETVWQFHARRDEAQGRICQFVGCPVSFAKFYPLVITP